MTVNLVLKTLDAKYLFGVSLEQANSYYYLIGISYYS